MEGVANITCGSQVTKSIPAAQLFLSNGVRETVWTQLFAFYARADLHDKAATRSPESVKSFIRGPALLNPISNRLLASPSAGQAVPVNGATRTVAHAPQRAEASAPDAWPRPKPARARGAVPLLTAPRVQFLRGRSAILAMQPRLADLAQRCGQTGEADSLAYFLSTPDAVRKTPHMLLIHRDDQLAAAVLLFEYRFGPFGTRVFATADGTGRRDVLAPPAMRARTAAFAARTMIGRGAQIVHLAFSETHRDVQEGWDGSSTSALTPPRGYGRSTVARELAAAREGGVRAHWGFLERTIPAFLPLAPTFDQTLAHIGQRTRSNLRYYRRRAEADLGAVFVPEPKLTLEQFLAFNRECTYAVPEALATFRYQTFSKYPHFALRGLRDREGRWLSLVGTRRQNHFADLDWQMNRDDHRQHSLATVMRSYLIEHEIALGSTRLYIEGGTPQPIQHSFLPEQVSELTIKRDSAFVKLLEYLDTRIFPPKNYIGSTLRNPEIAWSSW